MSNPIKSYEETEISIDSALDENPNINESERYSEAMRLAVQRSTPKIKQNGLPIGVHSKEDIERHKEREVQKEAKEKIKDKRVPARMRAFATYIALGDSPTDAVKKAYNTAKSSQASIYALANRLMKDARVNVLLESLTETTKEFILKEEIKTRKYVSEQLFTHAHKEANPLSLRIRSLELLGKSVGMFTDRIETINDEHDIEQLKKELEQSMTLLSETDKVRKDLQH